MEKAREFQKNIYFCFIEYDKAFDCVDHNKLENSWRDGNTRPPDLPPEKSVWRSRSKLELNMEQQTGSKSGKEYIKAIYCHPAYLTYMQSTSGNAGLGEAQAGIKIARRNINNLHICRWHHPYGRKWRRTKELLDESEIEERKSWLKTQHSEH